MCYNEITLIPKVIGGVRKMKNWSLNNLNIAVIQGTSSKDMKEALHIPVKDRENFSHNEKNVNIPRFFYRIIGIENEESNYYNYLFDLHDSLTVYQKLYLHVPEGFETKINKDLMRDLNVAWSEILLLPEVTGEIIVKVLNQHGLFVNFPNEALSKQLRGNFQGLIEYYFEINNFNVDPNELKQLIFYLISWSYLYIENLFMDFDYINVNPKVLFYGDIAKEEVFFLIYLSSLGCDVLYFNPLREYYFEEVDRIFSTKIEFNRKMKIDPFPTKKVVGRATTVAYGASQQIQDMLGGENSLYYRPWQFLDNMTQAVTLKTTYEEIYMVLPEKAMIRPEWKVEKGVVYIPNVFAKVYGVHSSKSTYWKEIHQLAEEKNTLLCKTLPISQPATRDYYQDYYQLLDDKGRVVEDKLLQWAKWPYENLPTSMQKRIAHEISEMCNKPIVFNKNIRQEDTLKIKTLSKLLEIEEKFIQLLQKFDFPQEVPKVIIFNNEHNGDLSFEDALILKLLNRLGLDIVIYNPTGHNDIENYIEPKHYDIHRLEEVAFDLDFKEKSLLSRLFS